jgi:hypothetical protein
MSLCVGSDETVPLSPPAICVNQLSRDDVDDTAMGRSRRFDKLEMPPSAICCYLFDMPFLSLYSFVPMRVVRAHNFNREHFDVQLVSRSRYQ